MDTVFFLASKVIWALISPDSLIVILGVSAWIAATLKWQRSFEILTRKLCSAAGANWLLPGWRMADLRR